MTHYSTATSQQQHPTVVHFLNAVRYYEFLQRQYPQAWAKFERQSGATTSAVPTIFRADYAFYHGQYREAQLLLGNVRVVKRKVQSWQIKLTSN